MAPFDSLYTIILAGGKGRRMRSRDRHKVCFEIAGVPAIVRTIDAYNRLGVTQNVVVVGDMAGQVVETVGRHFSNVVFAYQREARGTGDAARCGLQALAGVDDRARVLVVAGDKLIENATLARLLDHFERTGSDLSILVTPAEIAGESAGRILFRADGSPLAIIEMSDVRVRACRAQLRRALETSTENRLTSAAVEAVFAHCLGKTDGWLAVLGTPSPNGQADALERDALLNRLATLPADFRFGHAPPIAAADVAHSRFCNESVYLVRKGALRFGLDHMTTDNAQGEEYLTDAVGAVLTAEGEAGRRYRATFVATDRPGEVMSYNNPEELLAIEDRLQGQRRRAVDHLHERLGPERFRTADDWLVLFPDHDDPVPNTDEALRGYYGDDPGLWHARRRAYRRTLLRFRDAFGGDRRVLLVRSPGRVNIMGRHIDWQGGHCNLMAVEQEVIMAVAPRADDKVEIRNVEPERFPDASISLSRLVSQLNWDDWLSCVNGPEQERRLRAAAGNWSLYIEAAMLRLQMAYRAQMLTGMDLVVSSNIPVAAGMSSSSALVVATGEAAAALNGLDILPRQFVNFCGEGEWFVGTRGGSADHAAMKMGAKGTVIHVKFHDFELLERIRFPATHRLVVCNSFVEARKAAGARAVFNARVASYRLGVELVRARFPQYAPFIRFVRDLNPQTLHVPLAQVYEILLELPEVVRAGDVRKLLGDDETWTRLASHFTAADAPAEYPVRGVVFFGMAECARARAAVTCLKNEDMAAFGELMRISHDGERGLRVHDDLTTEPFHADVSDAVIGGLIADQKSGDPARLERSALERQPGAYGCSTPEIDALVDLAGRTPGVLGAQIAGAGLGGCAMVLATAEAVDPLRERLAKLFYQPKGLPLGVYVCTPAAGSRVVAVEG